MRDPLLAPVIALASGIALAQLTHLDNGEVILGTVAFAVLALVARRFAGKLCASVCLWLTLAGTGVFVRELHRAGPAPRLNVEANELVILEGCVVEPSSISETREKFLLELGEGARIRVSVTVREGERPHNLAYGKRIEVQARVREPNNFQNPGSFDYVHYLARRHTFWTASARSTRDLTVLPGSCGTAFWSYILSIRQTALARLEKIYRGDAYSIGMMQAMLIGENSKLEEVWTDHFRRTGTYHALVISGLHVSVLAAALLLVLRVCFVPLDLALALTALAAWLYALVSGWSAPVVRSAGGFTLFLVARLFFRKGRVLNVLAAIAIAFLLADPEQLFEASFQLSFLSVAAIGALAMPLIERTSGPLASGLEELDHPGRDPHLAHGVAQFRVELRLLAEILVHWLRVPYRAATTLISMLLRFVFFLYELAMVSAVVQVGLALPMILYFHRISLSGLSANLLVVPMLSAAVPAGFAAIFTGWLPPAAFARWMLNVSRIVVDRHAALEPGWRIPDPPAWLAVLFVITLLLAARAIHSRPVVRAAAFATLAACFLAMCVHPFSPEVHPGQLELTAVDVGQGDSFLVAFPKGPLMLVDTGGIPTFKGQPKSRLDIGEDVVSPYLWSRSIRKLDIVVSTHAHEDHMGGLAAIIENFHPRELWTGANPESPVWAAVLAAAGKYGVQVRSLHSGDRQDYGGAHIEVLAPSVDYQTARTPKNNDSLVMRISYGKHKFLLTGDMEREGEFRLLADERLGHADVLKVAHHGSRSSSTPGFLEAVRPAFALISAGPHNFYHHPHEDVLDRLAASHAQVFRTDRQGLTTIRSDGRRLMVDAKPWTSPEGLAESAFGLSF